MNNNVKKIIIFIIMMLIISNVMAIRYYGIRDDSSQEKTILKLQNQNVNYDSMDETFNMPLSAIILSSKDYRVAKYVLTQKFDVNLIDINKNSILDHIINEGWDDIGASFIIDKKPDITLGVDIQNKICLAIRKNKLKTCTVILNNYKIDKKGLDYYLSDAIELDRVNFLELFINYFKLDIKNELGFIIMSTCVQQNSINCVNYLIKNGYDVNYKSVNSHSLLKDCKSLPMLEILMNNNINMGNILDFENSALNSYIKNKKYDMVEKILTTNPTFSKTGSDPTPLLYAVDLDDMDTVKLFEKYGYINNFNNSEKIALMYQCKSIEMMKYFASKGIDINTCRDDGITLLHTNSRLENKSIMQYLLNDMKYDVNCKSNDGRIPLMFWAKYGIGFKGVADILLSKESIVMKDNSGKTAIHYAALNENDKPLKILITYPANITLQDNDGNTPLHLAIQNDVSTNILALLDAKADYTIKNKLNIIPLEYIKSLDTYNKLMEIDNEGIKSFLSNNFIFSAVKYANIDLIEYLIETDKKSLKNRDNNNMSLVQIAVKSNNIENTKYLLSKGININQRDNNGNTALHIAVENKNSDIISLLLAFKADKKIKNKSGKTPFDIAKDINAGDDIIRKVNY